MFFFNNFKFKNHDYDAIRGLQQDNYSENVELIHVYTLVCWDRINDYMHAILSGLSSNVMK